ncbi:MAG: SDR family oxidoreductase [Tessaracoccus sp.]|uniref:SDR family NAD(P)-dependent oxidoreductase n=1 Tax=Tessaracoccus sp. TaxID=1971211 RepID=UPI001EB34C5B|nr:SDR family oxidoreductase [Tessaracoccus sp.]MBK7821739.1 SDR family oxidoreductase [Tessaracoccus sp.]
MDLGLNGRKAIVTGGSKGLGLAIAKELVAEGATVRICARDADEVAAAVAGLGERADGRAVDVRDAAQLAAFVEWAAESMGGVDVLVNNAGGAHPGTFQTLDEEALVADFNIKVLSWFRAVKLALPWLRRSDAPRVINIGSVYARMPDFRFFSTTVNRAAGQNVTKALAQELATDGVLVNSVNIGCVKTPQWANIHAKRAPEKTAEQFFADMAEADIPLGRFGEAHEVSGVVAFLAGSRSSYITGASIDVAGGMGRYS